MKQLLLNSLVNLFLMMASLLEDKEEGTAEEMRSHCSIPSTFLFNQLFFCFSVGQSQLLKPNDNRWNWIVFR